MAKMTTSYHKEVSLFSEKNQSANVFNGHKISENFDLICLISNISIAFMLLFCFSAQAQLGVYTFTGTNVCPNNAINVTAQPANATFSTFTTTGTTCTNSNSTFLTTAWNTTTTISLTEFNQFSITPSNGYALSLTSLSFNHSASKAGTSTTTWYLRSSLDNFASNIATGATGTGNLSASITLPAATFTNVGAVIFRIYLTAANSATTTWANDNVTLNGSVMQLPANPANPTSNSPQCAIDGVTLTATGSVPATETWYWQTSASGTSTTDAGNTYTAFASGTYYIRARNNTTLAWSPGAGSVTVTATPDVGVPVFAAGFSTTRCQGAASVLYSATATNTTGISYSLDATSLAAGNTIDATGTVTYTAAWSGTSVITASAAGCNGPTTAFHTVTITPTVGTPVFTLGGTSTRCQGAGTVTYTASATNTTGITYSLDATTLAAGNTINAATGAVTYVAGWSGTTTVRASASGCSGPKITTHSVTVTPTVGTPVFTLGASSTRCQGNNTVTYTATATNNTAISYSLDATSNAAGNAINSSTGDVTFTAGWTGSSVITATAAGCNGPKTANHTVSTTASVGVPVFTLGTTSTRCQASGTVTYTATATTNTGITYTLDAASLAGANSINAATGAVTYAAGWSGTTVITASAAGCNGPKISTHTVSITPLVTNPTFTLGTTSVRCQGPGAIIYSATASNSTSITYSLDATSLSAGNTVNPSTGQINFTAAWTGTSTVIASAAGCSGPKTGSHTITITATVGTPVFSLGTSSTRCQGPGTIMYSATATNATGISYSLDATSLAGSNTINASTGAVTYVAGWTGTSVITASAAGCNGPITANHTVTITPTVGTPVFTLGTVSTRCQGAGSVTYSATATNNTAITYSLDAASITGGNSVNAATGAVTYVAGWSGTSIITASAAGCNGPAASAHTVTITPTVGTPVFILGVSSSRCQGINTITYTATSTNSTVISYSLDAVSSAAGITINSATGDVTYTAGWTGTSVITATAAGCNGPRTSNHTVTTTASVGLPVFTLGGTSSRCQASGTVTYIASATSSTGISYSLDAASLAGANTINATTGVVTYAAGWTGTTVVTASAAGCNGPQTTLHTVSITPLVTTPVFALGSTSARCQLAETIIYAATASNTTSVTYSLDATSIAGGNTINASTGAVTYALGWSGTTTITASAAGCSGPKTATHTVTINPGATVSFSPATSTRCQLLTNVNYIASFANNLTKDYSLDPASLAAGLTINSSSGIVSYTATWTGTAIITATASGCNGTVTAQHTATTTPLVGTPAFSSGATSVRCQGAGNVTYAAAASDATGITYILDAASISGGNIINASTGAVAFASAWTGTSVITASAAGCSGPTTSTHTVTITPSVGTPAFAVGATSSRCMGAAIINYSASATTNTGITYSLDAASLAAGNSIDANTGDVSYTASWVGTTVITASATGCSGPKTAMHTVTVSGPVTTPVFTSGTSSVRCQGAGTVTYTSAATYATAINYNLDAATLAGGNSINAATGAVTYVAGWSGTSVITATAAGCFGPQSNTHTVTITPTVGTPVFTGGATSTRCQGAGNVTYDAAATTTTGITYTLNAASLTAGNTINAATGQVTYVGTYSGTTIITASAAGCNGPATATHTVTVTSTVGTPVFTLGATSTRCQGSNTVTYAATATTSTGMSYALDAASLAAGNTINAATGAVAYDAAWTGTSIITATATGCNGPTTANHTVTITQTVGTPVFSIGATSSRCQGGATITYTASATNTTGITYSISGGPSINAATGAVNYAAGYSGTAIITASAAGCNGPATATHTVTVIPTVGTPVFALGATSSRCQGAATLNYTATATTNTGITYVLDAASLTAGNTIDANTGDVTYVGSWVGSSVITATATGCNGPKTASHTVTTNGPVTTPVFTMGSTSTICQNAPSITYTATSSFASSITYSLDATSLAGGNSINTGSGKVNWSASWSGTSTVTATAAGCFGPQSADHTVTVTPTVGTPVFTLGPTSTRCQGAGIVTYDASATTTTGVTYTLNAASLSAGNTINATTGEVSYVATYSGTTIITASAAGCNGPKTATHTVSVTATVGIPVFSLGATSTRCQGANTFTYSANATTSTGMSYTLDAASLAGGNSINAATGAVAYAGGWTGTSVITATASGCSGPTIASHTVTITPTVGTPSFTTGPTSVRCQGAGSVTYTATAANTTGITYSLDAASVTGGNSIASATGVVTYASAWSGTSVITASAAGCNGPKTSIHTVTVTPTVGTPVFMLGATSARCMGAGTVNYTAAATNNTGITYNLDATSLAAGNTIDANSGDVTYDPSWVGISIITASATGCNGPKTANHTVTVNGPVTTPVFTTGTSSVRCQGAGTVTYSATSNFTSGITYSLDAASLTGGNSINSATGAVTYAAGWSGTSIITASASGCVGPQTNTHTVTITPTVGTPVFTLGAASARCQGAGSIIYDANATTNTGITYTLSAASLAAGNTINASTGEVNYVGTFSGMSIVTASASGCNGPRTATHTVTVTATVGTPVFASGTTSTRCQGAGSVTYTATATTSTGISYTLDGASISGGNTINTTTGAVTYVAGWSGTSVILATATGCNGPTTASHTVTITPTVGTPAFTLGLTSIRCQGAATVTYTASSTNTTGITYSLDVTSTTGGNTINSSTGTVTYAASWSGTSIITASAAGCSGPRISTHTVTVTPTVGTPVFTLGATSARCQGANAVSYAASATNSTGITYFLDGTSLAAGNTIDVNSGTVTYDPSWVGSTIITASAAGCNGPRTATHTVTVNPSVTTPVFTLGVTSTRCQQGGPGSSVTYTATAFNTTGITYTLDAASVAGGNTINGTGRVSYVGTWSGTSTVTASAAGCNGPTIAIHTITTTPTVGTPVFALGATSSRCQGAGTVSYTATALATTGIIYTLDATSVAAGNTINSASGDVTYTAAWTGTSTITASASGCSGPKTATHTVTITPTVGTPSFTLGTSSSRCQGAGTVTYTATASNATSIVYTLDATSLSAGNTINSSTGAVTYAASWFGISTVTATGQGCNGPSSTSIHIATTNGTIGTPVFSLGTASVICQGAAPITYTATSANSTVITYSLDAASITGGNSIVSTTGAVTYSAGWAGTTTITASVAGCGGPKTSTHTVTITPSVNTPVFTIGASSSRCQGAGIATYGATATNTTGITYSLDGASLAGGNTINISTGDVTFAAAWSGTSIITASASGCNGPRTANHTVSINAPVQPPVYTAGSTSTRCQGAGSVTYSSTAANSTGITYSLDAASLAGGNAINAGTGVVTYSSTWTGSSIITASAAGCYGPQLNTHTVTITPSTGTPSFDLGATSTRCQGAGIVTYNATANNIFSMSYSLDGTSLTAGNTINASTGAVTYVASWAGTSIITATASGCNGPKSTAHTVTVTPTVGLPVFTLGASSIRCQGAGVVTYTATATNSIAITYSLDAISRAAGNTINSATGAVTYVAGWSGISTITTNATGCNGPRTSTHIVTTNATVAMPVFSAGNSSVRCQGLGTVTYTATAANSTSITYSLNAASITGGCTINAATGIVSYDPAWNGTTIVTATASGCSGPISATHTVTITPTVGTPVFALGSNSVRCIGGGTSTFSASASNATSILYSLDAASLAGGNAINSVSGDVTFVSGWSATTTITASAQGCNGPATAIHSITTNSPVTQPVFAMGDTSVLCQGSSIVTYTATASNATSFKYTLDAASLTYPNVIDSLTGKVTWAPDWSGTSTVKATVTGCFGPLSTNHVIRVLPTVGSTIFSLGTTSTRCQVAETITYTAFATNAFSISYSLDAASIAGGNTINTSTGAVKYVSGWSGNSRITASAAGCSGPTVSIHTVTTNLPAGNPIFALGNTSSRCRKAGDVSYVASSAFATAMTYVLDPASLAGGNTINPNTGVVTYVNNWSGNSTITATAVGCFAPSSSHVVYTNSAPCTSTLFGTTSIEKVPVGSYVINMGITPQTAANGLKPYGLIYALLKSYVPVKWAINPLKNKDGIDFSHNGVDYKGGTFIILAPYISPAIVTLVNSWKAKGVGVNTTVSPFDVEVSYTLNSAPFWVMDAQNGKIAVEFLNAAEIPSSAYIFKNPDQLNNCDDIYVMPHADPTWATHKNLWYWNKTTKGAIWEGCHAVSVMENLSGPDVDTPSITRKMNFLMNDNAAGPDKTAVLFSNHKGATPPYVTQFPTHPIMQYMGTTDNAHTNGSEQVFLPYKPGGGWRSSTTVAVFDPSQEDIPAKSDGAAGIVTFGRGFGDPNRGYIVTEAGHNVGGTSPDQIAAQRIFLNSSFVFVLDKQANVAITNFPSATFSGITYAGLFASANTNTPNTTFTYQWRSSGGGSFSNPTSATTNFTAPFTASATSITITVEVTDNCGRIAFDTKVVPLFPSPRPPVAVNDSATLYKQCAEPSITVDVLNNDYDPDGDPMTVSLLGNGVNGTFTNAGNGLITYVPNPGFVGKEQITYQVCDNTSRCATALLTIAVSAPLDANGCGANQYWGVSGKITSSRATIAVGAPLGRNRGLLDPDGTPGDSSTYTFFNSNSQAINYTLSSPIPARVANIDTFLYIFADASAAGLRFTVSQSSDSVTWLRSQQFTVNATDDFTEANAKKYGVMAGTRFIKIVSNQNNPVFIDAMMYKVFNCLDALPVAQPDESITLEDVPVFIDVLSNDADYQNQKLTVAGITEQPSFGYVAIRPDGTIKYVNKKDQIGTRTDFFKYRACNTMGLCAEAQVSVNIIADSCGAGRYKPFSLAAPIISSRNPTADSYIKVGQLTSNFATATQVAVKGSLDSLNQRALLRFDLSNIPPNAIIDTANLSMYLSQKSTPLNEVMNIYSLAKPWTEAGVTWNNYATGLPWTTAGGDVSGPVWASANMATTNNVNKTWNLRSLVQSYARGATSNNGISIRRSPEATSGYFLEARFNARENVSNKPSLYIRYRVSGACTAIGSIAPFAMPDTIATNSVTPITIDVRSNDNDYNGTGMAVALPKTTSAKGGTLSLSGNNILYTPPVISPRYNGPDTLTYRVCSSGLCDSAYVIVNITNAPPFANADAYTMLSNTSTTPTSITATVMGNDSDPENNSLSVPTIVTQPRNGMAVVSGNNIIYTPTVNFIGNDTLVYSISETGTICTALSDTALMVIRVNNRPPLSVNDAITINRCEIRTIRVLVNDRDPEGQALSIAGFTQLAAGNGTLSLSNNNTQIVYTPPAGGLTTNNPITFTYFPKDIYDAQSAAPATVSISFRAPSSYSNPVATADTFKINRNSTLYADVLTNDYDPDGRDINVPVTISIQPSAGTVTPLSNGLVQYLPASSSVVRDSFQYQITTNIIVPAGCVPFASPNAKGWVQIYVDNVPQANWDAATTLMNKPVEISILVNDFFGSNLPKPGPITIVSTPSNGAVSVLTNGSTTQAGNTFRYTPNNSFIGKDQFIYSICDQDGQCDTAIVYIRVKRDTDRDGIPDDIDIDDDNDGIVDVIEVCGNGAAAFNCAPGGKDPALDDNDDGIVNWQDPTYGALNAKGCNTLMDSDGDGVPDFLDLDGDNDGIPDVVEAGGVDTNGDGVIDNFKDTDGDGLSQNVDANNTGEAGSGSGLGFADTDNDNVPNSTDLDSDGDGIPDIREVLASDANNDGRLDITLDSDGDGLSNFVDGDINNDGIIDNVNGPLLKTGPDLLENGRASSYPNKNADRTGKANPYDLDADGDGITDATEAQYPPSVTIVNGLVSGAKTNGWANSVRTLASLNLVNSDLRGPADYLDIDSDDDGITDNIEGQSTFSYVVPTDTDNDGDGLSNAFDILVNNYGGNGITPYDHDFDNIPDYLDLDTDNDGALDINEASKYLTLSQTNINSGDADGDGLLDQFDGSNLNTLSQDMFRNVTNSQMGAGGDWNGPFPSGSNVTLIRSLNSGDRDWRAQFVLPLKVFTLSGKMDQKISKLRWHVQAEETAAYYMVERSTDGITFSHVAKISSQRHNVAEYSYDDDVKNLPEGKVYYRIGQLDVNGDIVYSNVVMFKTVDVTSIEMRAYPNPVKDKLTLSIFSLVQKDVQIVILDVNGKTVKEKVFHLEKGDNTFRFTDLQSLSKGVYLLKAMMNNVYVIRFVKE